MQIPGIIAERPVVALVDSGSTHSFLDPRVITHSSYHIAKTKPMLIEVANGGELWSVTPCVEG